MTDLETAKFELQAAMVKLYAIEALSSEKREHGEPMDERLSSQFGQAFDRYRMAERVFLELREKDEK